MKYLITILILFSMQQAKSQGLKNAIFHSIIDVFYEKEVPVIFADTLNKNLDEFVILDSRPIEEYDVSHIKGATLVYFDEFDLKKVETIDKDENIVVYCSVGYRSQVIAKKLIENGFTNVYNLYGGIFEWKNLDYEVVNNEELVTDSVHTYDKMWSIWLQNGIKVN